MEVGQYRRKPGKKYEHPTERDARGSPRNLAAYLMLRLKKPTESQITNV